MELTFDDIHNVATEVLELPSSLNSVYKTIGSWYFKFLQSSEKKIAVNIPEYDETSRSSIFKYVHLFSFIYRIGLKPRPSTFEGTCLFNVFEYSKRKTVINGSFSVFNFIEANKEYISWSDNIVIHQDRFFPVFLSDQLKASEWDKIYNSFKIFKLISRIKAANHPVVFNLNEDLCLFLSTTRDIATEDFILMKIIPWDAGFINKQDPIELETELLKQKFAHQINIRFPYNRNLHHYLTGIGSKIFEINLNSRFFIPVLSSDDISLLPNELTLKPPIVFHFKELIQIVETGHNILLFQKLADLRSSWRAYEFNKFTTPFPKYWLLFINKGLAKNEWHKLFEIAYPELTERPIYKSIIETIDLLYDLDWSKKYIESLERPKILLPEITGLRRKKLEGLINSFKAYLISINPHVIFVEHAEKYNYQEFDNLILLDGFNIVDLVNLFHKNEKLKIVIPDFLYFNYQPWIKYQVVKYQFDALLNRARQVIDLNFKQNLALYDEVRENIVAEIKKEIRSYRIKYKIQDVDVEVEEFEIGSEDFVLKSDEETFIKRNINRESENNDIILTTKTGNLYHFKGNERILIQRSSIISSSISQLEVGDLFILTSEVQKIINKEALVNKLSTIPETISDFQVKLSKHHEIYEILAERGLIYASEKYFTDKYVISEKEYTPDKFRLPRKKEHWRIICEFLGVASGEMFQAWISYYGRAQMNEIQDIYKYILNLCIDNNNLSEVENPAFIKTVSDFLATKKHVFHEIDEDISAQEMASTIITSVVNELVFQEVDELKKNSHE